MSTTGKRGRPRKDTTGKPQACKRAAPRTRANSHAENDEYEHDGEIDDTLQYVDEELQPGYAYIGKKSVPLRSVSLTNPLPKAPEDRLQALDLPDPVFLWQWTNYFNTILVGSPNDYSLHMNSFRQQLVETYSYSNQQEYAVKNLAHLDKMIGQIFGVGRRFGLLGDSMKDITMEPVHVELNQDGTPVWQPEIPDHQMLADLIYAMADGSGIVDMDSTKPWKHWQKMRLIDFATVAERVMVSHSSMVLVSDTWKLTRTFCSILSSVSMPGIRRVTRLTTLRLLNVTITFSTSSKSVIVGFFCAACTNFWYIDLQRLRCADAPSLHPRRASLKPKEDEAAFSGQPGKQSQKKIGRK